MCNYNFMRKKKDVLIHCQILHSLFYISFPRVHQLALFLINFPPWGPGGLSRECAPPYPQRDCKRRLNGAVCRNHRIKGWSRVGARTGTLKNPTKCLWRWEPDRRSNFFFSPPAHLCAVTYMTEISLIVTLNNQFNSTQLLINLEMVVQFFSDVLLLIFIKFGRKKKL